MIKMYIASILVVLFSLLFSGCLDKTRAVKSDVRFQSVLGEKVQLLSSSKDRESCSVCGMHLPTFYKTNHAGDTKNGTKQFCSIHCLVKENEINKTDITNVRVVDVDTLEFIPALKAFYVVGSSKPATMSRVSKYAFLKKSSALEFAKKYGGEVVRFYEAYDEATKDFF